jgi:hypothetical protein
MHIKHRVSQFIFKNSLTLVLGLLLVPFIIFFFFVYPVYDDYWYADVVRVNGFLKAQVWWRENASGRFLTTVIISISNSTVHSVVAHRLLLGCIAAIFLYSVWFLLFNFFNRFLSFSSNNLYFAYVLFLFSFFYTLPGISQVLYWLPGAATYLVGLIFMNIVAGLLLHKNKINKISNVICISFFSVCACGTSELSGLCIAGMLVIRTFFSSDYSDSFRKKYFSVYFFVLVGILLFLYFVVVRAPGNEVRFHLEKQVNPFAGNFAFACQSALISTLKFIYNLLFIKRLLLLLVPLIIWVITNDIKPISTISSFTPNTIRVLILVQFVILSFTYFSLFTYLYSTGLSTPIQRILALIHYVWVLNIVACGLYFGFLLKLKLLHYVFLLKEIFGIALLVFVVLLFSAPQTNAIPALNDFSKRKLINYASYMKKQRFLLRNCDVDKLKQQAPPQQPLIFVWDLSDEKFKTRYLEYYKNVLCEVQ